MGHSHLRYVTLEWPLIGGIFDLNLHLGAIQVLRNADRGGGVSAFLEKSVKKV